MAVAASARRARETRQAKRQPSIGALFLPLLFACTALNLSAFEEQVVAKQVVVDGSVSETSKVLAAMRFENEREHTRMADWAVAKATELEAKAATIITPIERRVPIVVVGVQAVGGFRSDRSNSHRTVPHSIDRSIVCSVCKARSDSERGHTCHSRLRHGHDVLGIPGIEFDEHEAARKQELFIVRPSHRQDSALDSASDS